MQINGNDIVIPVPLSVSAQKQLMLSYFKHMFPEGVLEEISSTEFMYFIDKEAEESWDSQGRTEENASKMFHVICRENELTLVCEKAEQYIDEITKNLKANWCF